jgi:predicted transcriptional regulator
MIYGKKTPKDLISELAMSKATLFRSLGFLLDAGFVDKEEVDNALDKRSSTFYYVSNNIQENYFITVPREVEEQAEANGKIKIIEEWKSITERAPSIFSNVLAKIFELNRKKDKIKPERRVIHVCDECGKTTIDKELDVKRSKRIKVFSIMENPNEDVFQKLQEFLKSLQLKEKNEIKKGEKMNKPISFVIDLMEFN